MDETYKSPLVYIYLDTKGIESLYAQTIDRLEVELVRSHSSEGRGGAGFSVSLGNLLSALVGLKEVKAQTKLESIRIKAEQAKTRLTAEHKLDRLSDYLVKTKNIFDKLQDAAQNASEAGKVVYFRAVESFDAPDFYPGGGGVREVNSSKAVVFTIRPQYDPSDSYFKSEPFHFLMSASLDNFTRVRGNMGATSHDAITFRGFSGKRIPLGVFGYLIRHSALAFQIKPYAIWHQN